MEGKDRLNKKARHRQRPTDGQTDSRLGHSLSNFINSFYRPNSIPGHRPRHLTPTSSLGSSSLSPSFTPLPPFPQHKHAHCISSYHQCCQCDKPQGESRAQPSARARSAGGGRQSGALIIPPILRRNLPAPEVGGADARMSRPVAGGGADEVPAAPRRKKII